MHDPRIGRFFAVDPLAPKYPHNSPYAFSENKVIAWVELEGLETSPTPPPGFDYTEGPEKYYPLIRNVHDANNVLNWYLAAYVQLHSEGSYYVADQLKARIRSYILTAPYEPTATFPIKSGSFAGGIGPVSASIGGDKVLTSPKSGNWENGASVKVQGVDIQAGVTKSGYGMSGSAGKGTLTFSYWRGVTSVTDELNKATSTDIVSIGASAVGGYSYTIKEGQTDNGTVVYKATTHSYVAGLYAGIEVGVVGVISWTTTEPIDSSVSAADNVLFDPVFLNWMEINYGDSCYFKILKIENPTLYQDALDGNLEITPPMTPATGGN
ncbi:MAG: hypothetical protein IPH66_04365 [Crocinitomicaceae bacterium]|nr:hypothetical protein [Crocinitomicaceae bacterium]